MHLHKKSFQINILNNIFRPALNFAVEQNNKEIVDRLLNVHDIDVNLFDSVSLKK